VVCGYARCIINLHFHHVDPRKKSFGLSMQTTKSLAAYREEMKKCVLVCANCHGEIEAGLVVSPPAGATFADYAGCGSHAEPGRSLTSQDGSDLSKAGAELGPKPLVGDDAARIADRQPYLWANGRMADPTTPARVDCQLTLSL
jgi:hypothetical protein